MNVKLGLVLDIKPAEADVIKTLIKHNCILMADVKALVDNTLLIEVEGINAIDKRGE